MNVGIPKWCHGVDGDALYVDTEGSLSAKRMLTMGRALRQILTRSHRRRSNEGVRLKGKAGEGLNRASVPEERAMLSRVHVLRVHDYIEQMAAINNLSIRVDKIEKETGGRRIKLIVIDSISFHFRYGIDDMGLRNRLLYQMSQKLTNVAHRFKIAIVLINQVTTRFDTINGNLPRLESALGEGWSHACTTRVHFGWQNSQRCAVVEKSSSKTYVRAPFSIVHAGFRDVSSPSGSPITARGVESKKRPRTTVTNG